MRKTSVGIFKALLVATSLVAATSANSGGWFKHKFGELRAYHGAWLNVCRNNGDGDCRTVQLGLKAGDNAFFGSSRLAVHVDPNGGFQLDFYKQNMGRLDPKEYGELVISIDGESVTLSDDQWRVGDKVAPNVIESFTIIDPALSSDLVKRMKAGSLLTMMHGLPDARGKVSFSLSGVTAALNAINKLYKTRTN